MFSVDSEASGEGKPSEISSPSTSDAGARLVVRGVEMAQCSATCGAPVAGALDGRVSCEPHCWARSKTKPEPPPSDWSYALEIPIDSRLIKWLNEFGFPVRLSASALSDPNYYRFVSQGIQQLCTAADVFRVFSMLQSSPVSIRVAGNKDNLADWG